MLKPTRLPSPSSPCFFCLLGHLFRVNLMTCHKSLILSPPPLPSEVCLPRHCLLVGPADCFAIAGLRAFF